MATDILEYMLPDPAWAEENHLAVAGAGGQPTYGWLDAPNKRIWEMKGSGGFPWDGNSFDESYVYQSITEQVWATPTTFKMFASKTWSAANGGIAWAPRYIQEGAPNPPIVTADSTYRIYTACGAFTAQTLGGPCETHIEGPYLIDFGGTLGEQSAIVQTYKWGPGYSTMEVNFYVKSFGHVEWQSWSLVNGVYVLKQTSLFNTLVSGGLPTLNFPCPIPVI
jgi:hypothetical protein